MIYIQFCVIFRLHGGWRKESLLWELLGPYLKVPSEQRTIDWQLIDIFNI